MELIAIGCIYIILLLNENMNYDSVSAAIFYTIAIITYIISSSFVIVSHNLSFKFRLT